MSEHVPLVSAPTHSNRFSILTNLAVGRSPASGTENRRNKRDRFRILLLVIDVASFYSIIAFDAVVVVASVVLWRWYLETMVSSNFGRFAVDAVFTVCEKRGDPFANAEYIHA